MFNSQMLDTAISLVFIYFFLSLLCSVIIEMVSALTKKRARMLRDGIFALLQQDTNIIKKLYEQPLFVGKILPGNLFESLKQSLNRRIASPETKEREEQEPKDKGKQIVPSYISSRIFVLSLLESLKQHQIEANKIQGSATIDTVANVKALVNSLPEGYQIKKALLPLLETAGDSMDKAISNMERWYDEAMERATGWYKRYSQIFAFFLALVISLLLNVDTFQVGRAVYRDQALRASIVEMAGSAIKNDQDSAATKGSRLEQANPGAKTEEAGIITGTATAELKDTPPASDPELAVLKERVTRVNKIAQEINSVNLPIGWQGWPKTPWDFVVKLLGILLTAFMVSLGSNFWFELLNKLLNIRNTGKKPLTGEEAEGQAPAAQGFGNTNTADMDSSRHFGIRVDLPPKNRAKQEVE